MTVRYITPLLVFSAIVTLLFTNTAVSGVYVIPSFILGLIFWNISEYSFHRFWFHEKRYPRKLKKYLSNGHVFHHRYPDNTDELRLPMSLTIPFSLLYAGGYYLLFGITNLGFFYSGIIGGMFFYEFMHYAAHHLKLKNRFFRYMRGYHMKHHHKNIKSNFMVSNPLLDYLFKSSS